MMNSLDSLLTTFGLMTVFSFFLIVAITGTDGGGLDIGCHVIGTEVNGDYSTEYLKVGNC